MPSVQHQHISNTSIKNNSIVETESTQETENGNHKSQVKYMNFVVLENKDKTKYRCKSVS